MKGWAEGDERVECGPHMRDTTRLTVSTDSGTGSSDSDGTCLKGREKRKKGSNSSERAVRAVKEQQLMRRNSYQEGKERESTQGKFP